MAQIDLYGADATQIRNQYRSALGREAGDQEVQGWLTGSYGGGGLPDWLKQISESDEARQRQTRTVGQQPNVSRPVEQRRPAVSQDSDTGWGVETNAGLPAGWDPSQWASASQRIHDAYRQYGGETASDTDVNKWLTGQYGYAPGGPGSVDAFTNAIRDIFGQRGGPPAATGPQQVPGGDYRGLFLNTLTSGLAPSGRNLESLAPRLQQYGIQLGPRNASGMIDTIILPDGSRWDVIESATLDGGVRWHWQPAGGSGGGVGGGPLPGNQYTDQYTQLLEEMIKSRLGILQGGINDPNRQQYEQAMQRRAQALAQAEPQYQQLLGYLQKRFEGLQGPGYTGAENEVIRTSALDPIERDRTAARQRVMEEISRRGFDPKSGIAQQMLQDVDREFDSMRASSQTALTTADLARRESRQQRAETLAGSLVDIPQARAREQLDVFSALDQLEQLMRNEEQARSREAIGYSGALADLGPQRLQLAMQAAGMGGTPYNMFNSLMQMAQLNQNSALLNSRNSGQLWSGLGSIAALLANAGRP